MIWSCSCPSGAFLPSFLIWVKAWCGVEPAPGAAGNWNQGVFVGISAPQTFKDVTPERYEILANRARQAGIPLSGHSGSASMFGIEVCWNYLPEKQELTIQCLRTPFFMRQGEVEAKIRSLVEQTAPAVMA
jgi:hypothetical protein